MSTLGKDAYPGSRRYQGYQYVSVEAGHGIWRVIIILMISLCTISLAIAMAAPAFSQHLDRIVPDELATWGTVASLRVDRFDIVPGRPDHLVAASSVLYDSAGRSIMERTVYQNVRITTAYSPERNISVEILVSEENINEYSVFLHDDEGRVLQRSIHSAWGLQRALCTYEYDPHGERLKYCEEWPAHPDDNTSLISIRDTSGRITSELYITGASHSNGILSSYTYANARAGFPDEERITVRRYRDNGTDYCDSIFRGLSGNLLRENYYESYPGANGEMVLVRSAVYDSLERISLSLRRGAERRVSIPEISTPHGMMGGSRISIDTAMWRASFYSYDVRTNPIRCVSFMYGSYTHFERREGEQLSDQRAEYSYDDRGNWIEALIVWDGSPSNRFIRRITYYPE